MHPVRTSKGYLNLTYCSACGNSFKPIKQWALENNYTVRQCRRLLRNKYLLGLMYKRKMYVAKNPDFFGEI